MPSVARGSRGPVGALVLVGLVGACSVYTTDLLETSTSITTGGTEGAVAGRAGGGMGGLPVSVGGKSSVDAAGEANDSGGDPGVDNPGGGTGGTAGGTSGSGGGGGSGATEPGGGTTSGGGTAGTTSVGGTNGGGGALSVSLIDDFEDQDITIEQTDGRGGVWYLFDDGTTGTTGPTPLTPSELSGAPADLGGFAMHITATGFSGTGTVGSGLGVDFRAGKKVYNASKFSGIRFWAKVGAGKNTKHRLQIADATTDAAGGKCNTAANAPNGTKCDDHFGIAETFTTAWAQYEVHFDELTQLGWGNSATEIDKAALYGLQFTAKPKLEVDLWLDQLEFF
jgi:hypothetical protein